jgi:hypothetical protein
VSRSGRRRHRGTRVAIIATIIATELYRDRDSQFTASHVPA